MFAYAPPEAGGSGFAIATGRFLGLLSSHWSPDLASETFKLLDSPDASLASALALLADGDVKGSFALAEVVDSDTHSVSIAVRGDIVVDLGSATTSRFSWPDGATWLAGEGHGVESLRLRLGPGATEGSANAITLPLARGVVWAIEASAVLAERPMEEPPHAGLTESKGLYEDESGPSDADPTPAPIRAGVARGVPAHDSPESALSRRPQPINLASHASGPSWTLQLPDGNELDAAPQIVVGRQPWRSDPDETSTYYVVAPSPRKEISGKHVEFVIVDNQLRARDLGSTNGTLVFARDKPPRLLHGGRVVRLDIGDTLDLGEGFRIIVGART